MEILRTAHLSKIYTVGADRIQALNDVSFSVESGEIIAVVGSSGSGKSTLFHILSGVDTPTTGTVFLKGRDIFSIHRYVRARIRRRDIGIIYQFNNLLPLLTVKENILLPALLDGSEPDMDLYNELIDMLDLREREDALPDELSGGQQQRVAIGRTLINKPSVVLSDEPTANLDMRNKQRIMDLFKICNRRYEQTVLLITHDESIARQTDRILTLEGGELKRDVPANYGI